MWSLLGSVTSWRVWTAQLGSLTSLLAGAQDIKKMADCGSLKGLSVSMKKHPDSLKVEGKLKEKLESSLPLQSELVLYQGESCDIFWD